ncbi:MAG: efflux RND transporter periplasmic adaptor subunit [Tepidisphaeraceae bacterium]
MRSHLRSLVVVTLSFVAALGLALSFTGCSKETQGKPDQQRQQRETVPVSVAPIATRSVQRSVEVVGTLYGDEEATISAKVPGRITTILKDVGDRSGPGEALAQIERTDYELARTQQRMAVQESLAKLGLIAFPAGEFDPAKVPPVERARLQAQNAQAKFRRGEKLYRQTPPLLSEQDFADLQTAYDVARSNYDVELLSARSLLAEAATRRSLLDLAEQRLRDTTVRAPGSEVGSEGVGNGEVGSDGVGSDGVESRNPNSSTPPPPHSPPPTSPPPTSPLPTSASATRFAVAARLVSVGEYVREGTAMFRLVAADPIKYRAQVPERFVAQVRVGQKARVSVEAYPDVFTGTVARINPQVDLASRTFSVEVTVPNPDGKLQPGSFARGSIVTYTDENVVFVPAESIVTFAGVSKVFTIADGKAVDHNVQTGVTVDGQVEIVKGLKAGGEVVVGGAAQIAGGAPVTVRPPEALESTRPATAPHP